VVYAFTWWVGFSHTSPAAHSMSAAVQPFPLSPFFCVEFLRGRFVNPSCSCCILQLIDKYQLCPHLYADNTQIYGSCHPSAVSQLKEQVFACVDEVALWMRSNRLQLNSNKTEVLWCASSRCQHQIPQTPVRACSDFIQPASSVHDLDLPGH